MVCRNISEWSDVQTDNPRPLQIKRTIIKYLSICVAKAGGIGLLLWHERYKLRVAFSSMYSGESNRKSAVGDISASR